MDETSPGPARLLVLLLFFFTIFNYFANGLFCHFLSNSFDYRLVYDAGKKIIEGNSAHIYDDFFSYVPGKSNLFYMYPSFVAIIFSPLSWLSFETAKLLLKLLTQACVIASFIFLLKTINGLNKTEKIMCFFMFFNFYPSFFSLQAGQSEFLLLMLLAMSFYFFQKKNDFLSALLLSVVIYFKLFPLIFLAYFIWKKEFKYSARLLLMLLLLGGFSLFFVDAGLQREYLGRVILFNGMDNFPDHQCITGFFSRLFTDSQYTKAWINSVLVKNVSVYLSSLFVILLTFSKITGPSERDSEKTRLEFSIIVIIMLILSRITDTHHMVFLLLPLIYLLIHTARNGNFFSRNFVMLIICYSFFSTYLPVVSMKYLDLNIIRHFFSSGPGILLLSLPFYFLVALWLLNLKILMKK